MAVHGGAEDDEVGAIRCYGILAKILDIAVKDRRLSSNVARGVKMPRKVKKEHVYLTHQQVHDLAAEAKHGTLVLVLAYTGLRWGEVTALRVKDVNPMRRRLNVVLNAVEVGSKELVRRLTDAGLRRPKRRGPSRGT